MFIDYNIFVTKKSHRHRIPAPVDRTYFSAWLLLPMDSMSKNKPRTSMTHVACESKPRSIMRSSRHPCTGNRVTTGFAAVYYGRAAHIFSAGIKCWHCKLIGVLAIDMQIYLRLCWNLEYENSNHRQLFILVIGIIMFRRHVFSHFRLIGVFAFDIRIFHFSSKKTNHILPKRKKIRT